MMDPAISTLKEPSQVGAQTPAATGTAARHPHSDHHSAQLLHAAASLLSMVVTALFILTFIAQPFRIPSGSMEPTLLVGDFLLVNKVVHAPTGRGSTAIRSGFEALPYGEISHGDIIVFRYPPDPKIHVVKRVIGIPGDRVRLKDGVVYLNGHPQQEPYVAEESSAPDSFRDQFPAALYTDPAVDPAWWMLLRREVKNGEYIVPANSYFVLGDNRGNSRDSRYWGLVPRQDIVGSPFVIYFSLRQASTSDVSSLPDDKLDHQKDASNPVTGFARWDRMFRVLR